VPRSAREERFHRVYKEYCAPLAGYALRRVDEPEDAADVVAETFLIAWRRLDDLPAGDEARLWLYGVARRVLANQRRAAGRRGALRELLSRELLAGELAAALPSPEPATHGPLRTAWLALRPADRDVLGLVTWEGLSLEQTAAVLGCSRTAAKLRVHRARRRLAKALAAAETGLKPIRTTGHVQGGRASACPGREEL
jgi:RNA polymerase sigma-70 factor, ECF subfamily